MKRQWTEITDYYETKEETQFAYDQRLDAGAVAMWLQESTSMREKGWWAVGIPTVEAEQIESQIMHESRRIGGSNFVSRSKS